MINKWPVLLTPPTELSSSLAELYSTSVHLCSARAIFYVRPTLVTIYYVSLTLAELYSTLDQFWQNYILRQFNFVYYILCQTNFGGAIFYVSSTLAELYSTPGQGVRQALFYCAPLKDRCPPRLTMGFGNLPSFVVTFHYQKFQIHTFPAYDML